jgi:hypothetical protein
MISEAKLIEPMKAEAARLRVPADRVELAAVDGARRAALDAKRERWIEQYGEGLIERDERDRRLAAIDADLVALDAAQIIVDIPQAVDWTQPPAIVNGILRAMWETVELGPDLLPLPDGFGWRRPEWRAE